MKPKHTPAQLAIIQVEERLAEADRIPDDSSISGKEYKRLLKEIARLEYMIATIDEHLITMLRAMYTPLKIEPVPYNALILAAKWEP